MTSRILTLPENTKGRDFVVGDIHGCYTLLDQALAELKFDPEKDRLIAVGDLVNRGAENMRCIEFLNQPWFFAVKGNHEAMFLRGMAAKDEGKHLQKEFNVPVMVKWMLNEPEEKLEEIRSAFNKLPIAIELETSEGKMGFVHGDIPEGMDWQTFKNNIEAGDKPTIKAALWGRERIDSEDESGVQGIARVFFGHTPVPDRIENLGNCFYVDTGGVFGVLADNSRYFLSVSDVTASTEDLTKLRLNRDDFIHTVKRKP